MYKIRRLLSHIMEKHENFEKHIITKSMSSFHITDEEFYTLQSLQCEYDYVTFDQEICVDRHPDVLRSKNINPEFIKDYEQHINEKFFVLYEYEKLC